MTGIAQSGRRRQHATLDDMDEPLAVEQGARTTLNWCRTGPHEPLCKFLGYTMGGDRVKTLAVAENQTPSAPRKRVRLFEHRVEHRYEVAGRGIDDLQDLGGGGLLLQGFARLGDEPRILHRDDRLRREILQQRDLLVGERADLLAVDA